MAKKTLGVRIEEAVIRKSKAAAALAGKKMPEYVEGILIAALPKGLK